MSNHTIVITMAGEGQRFREAGYTVPKYEIEVKGKTLFSWALESLQGFFTPDCHVVFVARQKFDPEGFITEECNKLGICQFDVILLDQLTDGQATTTLYAKQAPIQTTTPLLIYNIDTHVDPHYLRPEMMKGDGWIPCFSGEGNAWSFVRVDENNRALEVREKQRISPHATIGLYGFSSFDCFESAYKKYYSTPARIEQKERYIAPLYNQLIEDGQPVFIETLPQYAVYPLGTPDEVESFSKNRYNTTGVV